MCKRYMNQHNNEETCETLVKCGENLDQENIVFKVMEGTLNVLRNTVMWKWLMKYRLLKWLDSK